MLLKYESLLNKYMCTYSNLKYPTGYLRDLNFQVVFLSSKLKVLQNT